LLALRRACSGRRRHSSLQKTPSIVLARHTVHAPMKENLSTEKSKISITYNTRGSTPALASRTPKATLNTKNDFILGRINYVSA
jgi:hypothetical protein